MQYCAKQKLKPKSKTASCFPHLLQICVNVFLVIQISNTANKWNTWCKGKRCNSLKAVFCCRVWLIFIFKHNHVSCCSARWLNTVTFAGSRRQIMFDKVRGNERKRQNENESKEQKWLWVFPGNKLNKTKHWPNFLPPIAEKCKEERSKKISAEENRLKSINPLLLLELKLGFILKDSLSNSQGCTSAVASTNPSQHDLIANQSFTFHLAVHAHAESMTVQKAFKGPTFVLVLEWAEHCVQSCFCALPACSPLSVLPLCNRNWTEGIFLESRWQFQVPKWV